MNARVVNPDATSGEFSAGWGRIPLLPRLGALVLAPLKGIWTALFGSREFLARHLEVGVVYGAAHVRAVVHYLLDRYSYFAVDAKWMTVFEF